MPQTMSKERERWLCICGRYGLGSFFDAVCQSLYGFVIEKEMLEIIDQCRKDKDEIGKIAFLSELKRRREKIDEINEALLRFF